MPEDQNGRLKELTEQIYALYDERRTILQQTAGEEVEDYEFTASDGTKQSLSSLFAGKDELIVVHNMGNSGAVRSKPGIVRIRSLAAISTATLCSR